MPKYKRLQVIIHGDQNIELEHWLAGQLEEKFKFEERLYANKKFATILNFKEK